MSTRPRTTLAAALIVRDEEDNIEACLQALHAVVDEIHVHDTGSIDSTPELAARLGAKVTRGTWHDDFAAARNAAIEHCTADWVLSVDADEIVEANRRALRRLLRTTSADLLAVLIDNEDGAGQQVRFPGPRLFRPRRARWQGRVHEQVVGRDGPVRLAHVTPDVLRIVHHGYLTDKVNDPRSERNTRLARLALADLAAQGDAADRDAAAQGMVDLGRSLLGAAQLQDAIDTFEAVREHFPGTVQWLDATDFLTKILLGEGMVEVCLTLVLQLRTAGARTDYCNWIEAHCHARLGRFDTARELLAGVTQVVDFAGRREDPAVLAGVKRELDELAGTTAR